MYLIFDTETTGKANFKLPIADPSQPRVVQLGAVLMDADFKVRGEINLIVEPNGWEIPEEASNIHGITTETAKKFGIEAYKVFDAFVGLCERAEVVIAHNSDFDIFMMRNMASRLTDSRLALAILSDRAFCTMKAMTPICKLPGRYGDFKWPTLQEAFTHAFGRPFDGAHDAMADVRACADIFKWLKQKESAKNKPQTITKEEQPCLPSNPPKNPSA